jgi:drug/metabolite transporter (DMT)-like permease
MHEHEALEHLSKEITTHTQQLMTFRTRVTYTIWVGPFILLGSYLIATKDKKVSMHWDCWGILLLFAATVLFCGLSYLLARIEEHTWDQCNKWRSSIVRICSGTGGPLKIDELSFDHELKTNYFWACLTLLGIFLAVLVAVFR